MLQNDSFADVFSSISEVYVTSSRFTDQINVESDIHFCVIFKNQYSDDDDDPFPSQTFFDGKEYELRVVASINQEDISSTIYKGSFYSRHGGNQSKLVAPKT